jgi:photosystem II stability/assembly factor-like uncharacterized protein
MKKLYTTLLFLLSGFLFTANAQPWLMQNIGYTVPAAYPSDIDIVDANTVWTASSTVGDGSGVTIQLWSRTIDGGNNWSSGNFTADTNYRVSNISAVDANTCFILTFNNTAGSTGLIFKTVDGGATWDTVSTHLYSTVGVSFPNIIHFFDANNGFIQGDPESGYYEIYTTTDGGANWTRVPSANIPAPLSASEYGIINVYSALGDYLFFGTNNGRIFRSYDRGLTWTATTMGTATAGTSVNGVTFRDSLNGFATKSTNAGVYSIYHTHDAGATWLPITPGGTFFKSDFMYVPGTTSIISVSASTTGRGSSISYDDGHNWTTLDTAGTGTVDGYVALDFLNSTTGWAGGFAVDALTDGIYKWNGGTVGITETAASSASMVAYPNPSRDVVFIETTRDFKQKVTVSLVNVLGNVISEQTYSRWSNPVRVNLAGLAKGMYFVRVTSGSDVMISRVIRD